MATRGRIAPKRRANLALADQLAAPIETVAPDISIAVIRDTVIACFAIRIIARQEQCVCATTATQERIALSGRAKHAISVPLAAPIKTAAQNTRIAVSPAMAIVCCATQTIAHRHRLASVPTGTRESIAPIRRAIVATPDHHAAHIGTVAQDIIIAIPRAMAVAC
jgi:hypothetical protein